MDDLKEIYHQTKNIEFLRNTYGKELWVQVSGHRTLNDADAAFWAALTPINRLKDVYRDYSWDNHTGTQMSGFIEYADRIIYETDPLEFGTCENIINYREFHGIKPNYVEIAEEFRFLNNLYHDKSTNCFLSIEMNGECTEVAKIENETCVYIKLKYLMKYASAKQMALLLFFDIRAKLPGSLSQNGVEKFSKTIKEDGLFFGAWGDEMRLTETTTYSVLMGKKVILPKPVEECGYEPYTHKDKREYLDYIIGIDEFGEYRTYTSNPAMLSDYYGSNPGAPHYLTPVFFKKEVLQRYLSHPEIYSVEDGYLRCQYLWGMEIDNQHKELVSAYLGDLGRDLPAQEQAHWKQYNIATDEKLSATSFKRDFLCMFTEPEVSDLKFKANFERFQSDWQKKFKWALFLPLTEKDEYNFKTLHLPITGAQEEFDHLILALVKTIIDSLNEKEIVKQIKNPDTLKGGITKLERWFSELDLPNYHLQIKFLRDLQELRSTGTGHRKGRSYEKIATVFSLEGANYIDTFDRILIQSIEFLGFLRKCFLDN